MTNHDSSNVLWVISIHVELEGHHLVVVCLQLTLHHPVHFIRELQRDHWYEQASFYPRKH